MGRISDQLVNHTLIGVDTAIFIYHIETHPLYSRLTTELLDGVESGQWSAVTSVITIMELTVHPWRINRPHIAREYEAFLAHFPNLVLADVTRDIARRAAQLRARHRLRPADAIQIATAMRQGATAFVTNDRGLTRLSPDIEVVILDDFAP
jgi:predicted nucleic acid-binding protein